MAEKKARPWRVLVDPRVELVSALEALSGRNPCPKDEDSGELARVRASLDAGHEAVRLFAAMDRAAWRHRHPSLIILDFSDPPALEPAWQLEHYAEAGKDDAVSRLLPAARDFARLPAFAAWVGETRARHADALARIEGWIEESDYLAPLEEYLGLPLPHDYRFAVAPLLHGSTPHNVLYRPERPEHRGLCLIHSVIGHRRVDGGKADFTFRVSDFARTAWHEVCHTVVDPWTQERRAALAPRAPLYGLMTGMAKAHYDGPPGWLHMVDEHLIRAVTCRLISRVEGEEHGRRALEKERADGFALIGPVYELLGVYEKTRARHPTLREFYPLLEDLLARLHEGAAAKGRR